MDIKLSGKYHAVQQCVELYGAQFSVRSHLFSCHTKLYDKVNCSSALSHHAKSFRQAT